MSDLVNDLPVSIVIPTYNRAKLLGRSLHSVLAAVLPGDEVIVVDDGSTDNTLEVLEPFRDRIRYVLGPHRGAGAARNCGVTAARNPLVAFNDSDDEWFADKLELQRAFMRLRPDVLFCFTDLGLKKQDGAVSHNGLFDWHNDPRAWDAILGPSVPYSSFTSLPAGREDFKVHVGNLYEPLLRINYVPTQATVVRRAEAGAALRFGEDIAFHEDHECFIRLSRIGTAAYFDCETVWQCAHDEPRMTGVDRFRKATSRIEVLRRTYGSDEEFLARSKERYWKTLRAEHVIRARILLRNGSLKQAYDELKLAGDGQLLLGLVAALPGPVGRRMVALGDRARKSLKWRAHQATFVISAISAASTDYM